MNSYLYLFVNLGALIIPFIYSFHPKLLFYKKWKSYFLSNLITIIPFIIWDIAFTEKGIWGFNPNYLTGLYIWNLPIEEILFFLCIPYACVYTWHCFKVLLWRERFIKPKKWLNYFLIGFSLFMSFIFAQQDYTFLTFLGLAVLLVYLTLSKTKWLSSFYLTYLVLLIPFLIVNGILTGTGIESPIVWYNDLENIGIRILTIPIEDVFYGMTLILLNVTLFEHFNKKIA
ncbi:MAG: lycopene cyclase domain-containing protein [Bacteroidetes bacterium]|nr:MAG: lycopene cyclase domain-containing protein [Bacteroidota bacterium]MBL1145238.1 lycopene cyclase domain-containing protein [Bacteroidota bacterium]NOG58034.1 lycopene cyclase domain-containing protein [Bacteroidota bacterium]